VFKCFHTLTNVVLELELLDGSFDSKVIHLPVFPKVSARWKPDDWQTIVTRTNCCFDSMTVSRRNATPW